MVHIRRSYAIGKWMMALGTNVGLTDVDNGEFGLFSEIVSFTATEANKQHWTPVDITLITFGFRFTANSSGTDVTYTIRINGVNTTKTIVVGAGLSGDFSNDDPLKISAGDSWNVTQTGASVGSVLTNRGRTAIGTVP